jgi:hypothetical protein
METGSVHTLSLVDHSRCNSPTSRGA